MLLQTGPGGCTEGKRTPAAAALGAARPAYPRGAGRDLGRKLGMHERQTDTCSGRPWCCPSSLSQRHRKRSGQKARDARKANRRLQRSPLMLPIQFIPEAQEEIWAEISGCTEGKQTPAAVALDAAHPAYPRGAGRDSGGKLRSG